MNVILIAVISLGAIALVAAVILYVAAVDVVTRVVADLPMLASRQVRWKVNFVRWADSLS